MLSPSQTEMGCIPHFELQILSVPLSATGLFAFNKVLNPDIYMSDRIDSKQNHFLPYKCFQGLILGEALTANAAGLHRPKPKIEISSLQP